jgi:hypothetical protein
LDVFNVVERDAVAERELLLWLGERGGARRSVSNRRRPPARKLARSWSLLPGQARLSSAKEAVES